MASLSFLSFGQNGIIPGRGLCFIAHLGLQREPLHQPGDSYSKISVALIAEVGSEFSFPELPMVCVHVVKVEISRISKKGTQKVGLPWGLL